ncbi:MAG: OsmC family protein [Chitinophagales bacterium]
MEKNTVTATATSGEVHYRTLMQARTHLLYTDEPEEDGGKDSAPKPGELLCMSLASCTAITLQMYAGRKQWETGTITVKVTRIMEEKLTRFETDISFGKELPAEMKERLYIIAKKCPVHKILSNPITIETKIAG